MNFNLPDPLILIPLLLALSLAPVFAVMVTCYAKLVVVFSILRNALGLQQTPPNMVTNGLALILTWHVMFPVGNATYEALTNLDTTDTRALATRAIAAGKEPLRQFLIKHSSEREKEFFLSAAKRQREATPELVPTTGDFSILVPAFLISELTKAFLIGFLIFLPFLIVDLVTANVLMAMGMQMLSPTVVSLPIKLLLFVLVDGWSRLSHALVLSYV